MRQFRANWSFDHRGFGAKVREVRTQRRISASELARVVGCTLTSIVRVECGTSRNSCLFIFLALWAGIDPRDFVTKEAQIPLFNQL